MSLGHVERDAIIVACAISAGIHAALTPDHFAEGLGAGVGFAAGAALLAVEGVALTRRPDGDVAVLGAALVLAGLIVSYGLAITTGLPVLHPEPEPVTALALFTKGVEGFGLLAATHLLWSGRTTAALYPRLKGRLT
jgi:drug/metabolite transporter (DMT)-like permease